MVLPLLAVEAPEGKPPPVSATLVKFDAPTTLEAATAELAKQSGIVFVVPPDLKAKPIATKGECTFWQAAESLAVEARGRLRIQSGKVHLVPLPAGTTTPPSSLDGPFRVVLRQVVARHDFETSTRVVELHLDAMWEPKFPVYLIDAEPKIVAAKAGALSFEADKPGGRVAAGGYVHSMVLKLRNVPRDVKTLDEVSGSFGVIAAAKMLAVEFKDLTVTGSQTVEGVKVSLRVPKAAQGQLEVIFDLEYPPSHPEFESFQAWAGTNKLRIYDAQGKALPETDNYNTAERGRIVTATYQYPLPKGAIDLKKWRLVYETPSPMVEQNVKFTLKNIPLP